MMTPKSEGVVGVPSGVLPMPSNQSLGENVLRTGENKPVGADDEDIKEEIARNVGEARGLGDVQELLCLRLQTWREIK